MIGFVVVCFSFFPDPDTTNLVFSNIKSFKAGKLSFLFAWTVSVWIFFFTCLENWGDFSSILIISISFLCIHSAPHKLTHAEPTHERSFLIHNAVMVWFGSIHVDVDDVFFKCALAVWTLKLFVCLCMMRLCLFFFHLQSERDLKTKYNEGWWLPMVVMVMIWSDDKTF